MKYKTGRLFFTGAGFAAAFDNSREVFPLKDGDEIDVADPANTGGFISVVVRQEGADAGDRDAWFFVGYQGISLYEKGELIGNTGRTPPDGTLARIGARVIVDKALSDRKQIVTDGGDAYTTSAAHRLMTGYDEETQKRRDEKLRTDADKDDKRLRDNALYEQDTQERHWTDADAELAGILKSASAVLMTAEAFCKRRAFLRELSCVEKARANVEAAARATGGRGFNGKGKEKEGVGNLEKA